MTALRRIVISFLFALLYVSPAQSAHWDLAYRFCPIELVRIPDLIKEIPIPVGCEVVDCCPGCPGPGFIDWKIRVDGEHMKGIRIRLTNVTQEQLQSLKLSKNARLEKDQIIVTAGEATISGLPFATSKSVAVGYIQPILDETLMNVSAKEMDSSAQNVPTKNDGDTGIEITQLLGDRIVNDFGFKYAIRPCLKPPAFDKIQLTNNTSNDNATIMADYRTSAGCINDTILRTTSTAYVGNALTKDTCDSEVSVFSDDNAMSFQPNVTTWTDAVGDTHTVNLQGMINVPVSVWVTGPGMLATATNDFANANLLYNQNNTGIQFTPTFNNVSGNAAAVTTIGTGCGSAAAVQGSAWYTANAINIYYVNSAFTGVNCGLDRNISYIGTTANLGSLPHEIGHAYGLRPSGSWGHTNGVAGFGNNNIMWGGGPGTRNQFSVGQSFRLNTHTGSMLNNNGNRAGPTRDCAPNVSDNQCPALALDSLLH